ncbi:AAA family ATPase [Mongoliimonas terrestris]|uniref:AAA family ATPase n=1 Tax=Mongoliimonas terrestris TaxID=1709001 RepID=UPI000949A242|nr:ATP-binding protein [Mongoliimonas terrestris]
MDRVRNPFAPGAGNPPPELAGRQTLLDDIATGLGRTAMGRPAQGTILVGLRGVGKTVLLVKAQELAEGLHYRTLLTEAREGRPLPDLIVPGLKSLLYSLSTIESAKELSKRAIRVLRSFVASIKISIDDFEYGLSVDPEPGVADSGTLESDLPDLFEAVGMAARAAGRPVLLLVDELQYFDEREFGSLIMAMHRISQKGLPIHFIGAGLPQILGLAGESKSYAERLFRYPRIGALATPDAHAAIVNPVEDEGAAIDEAAVRRIIEITEGYPYFLQQWSHDAWNICTTDRITEDDVIKANVVSVGELDESFFRVRFDRCTPAEKRYMRALAELGPGPHRSGEIADLLGVKTTSVGPVRGKLIRKGMIYSPQHGDTAFTVPLFDAYMRRAMPTLD